MTPYVKAAEETNDLIVRIDKATDILLESSAIYDSERMCKRVCDAFYLLIEGVERG